MTKNNAKLPEIQTLLQAGINPKTGLPVKLGDLDGALLNEVKRLITILDRQDYLSRFEWYNLPSGLDSTLLERILYYRGQGAFFYMPTNNTFYFLPYALDGNIDVYGRYLGITPLPFAGPSASTDGDGKQKPWIKGLIREPVYEIMLPEEVTPDVLSTKCVLLRDYSHDISQTIVPRSELQRALIDAEAECLPRLRTALIGMSGIAGLRVGSEDEYSNVLAASKSMDKASLIGDRLIPIVGQLDFQDLGNNANIADVEQFSLAMQLFDNLRLSTLGINNGGLFQKQGTTLQSQQDNSSMANGYILMDGLKQRQDFCAIVNSIFGLQIWCEIAQPEIPQNNNTMGADSTGQGDDSQWQSKGKDGGDSNDNKE